MTQFEKDIEHFREWLVDSGMTSKLAIDCISRCRRVEKVLNIDLKVAVSNNDDFQQLIADIKTYVTSQKQSFSSREVRYATSNMLRAASRKYAEFKYPSKSKDYPKHKR